MNLPLCEHGMLKCEQCSKEKERRDFIRQASIAAMQAIVMKTEFDVLEENLPVPKDTYTARGAVHYATALWEALQANRC